MFKRGPVVGCNNSLKRIRGFRRCWYSSKTMKPVKEVIYPTWMVLQEESEVENKLTENLPNGWVYKLKRDPSKEDLPEFYLFERYKEIE